MITAIYDLYENAFGDPFDSEATADDVRRSVMNLKMEALMENNSLDGMIYVAFDSKDYFSVFTLHEGDESKLTEELLNRIRELSKALISKN